MWRMTNETTETPTDATAAQVSANGTKPVDVDLDGIVRPVVGGPERVMFAVMLLAGAGLLFLAVDGLTGYAISRALFQPASGDGSDG
jgi:hypothetical protein